MNTASATAQLVTAIPIEANWTRVCAIEDILPGTGVCALVRGQQIAVIRPGTDERIFALSNYDPFSKAFVLSRGIVGDKGGVAKIASPIYKQSFELSTGQCLDDPSVCIPSYEARVIDGQVELFA